MNYIPFAALVAHTERHEITERFPLSWPFLRMVVSTMRRMILSPAPPSHGDWEFLDYLEELYHRDFGLGPKCFLDAVVEDARERLGLPL